MEPQDIHPSYQRLMIAFAVLAKVEGGSAVADLLGSSPQSVSNWRKAPGVPSKWAVRAQSLIGCNSDWILYGKGDMTQDDKPEQGAMFSQLCADLKELDPPEVELLLAQIHKRAADAKLNKVMRELNVEGIPVKTGEGQ